MAVILDAVHTLNETVHLTSLPRSDNVNYAELKELLGKPFIFTGYNTNNTMGLYKSSVNGATYTLTPLLFLDHDRFYYEGTSKAEKTALMVVSNIKARDFNSNKTFDIRGGTIFSSFEKVAENRFLVTSNSGTKMTVPLWACKAIVDIEYEPQPSVLETAVQEILDTVEKAHSKTSFAIESISQYRVGNQVFNNQADAQSAIDLLNTIQNAFSNASFSSEEVCAQVRELLSTVDMQLLVK